jgi:hypothetical protein
VIALASRPILPAGRANVDVRLSERWGCQPSTARARRQRAVDDIVAVLREHLALGDTDEVGHIMALIDAVLAGPAPAEAIYLCDKADAEEDLAEAEYRRHPCVRTARRWFDALGREGRSTEPAMAALREEWEF